MSCYCNGNLSDAESCPSLPFPLSQNRNCSLNCSHCEWTNLSEWSLCTGGSQNQTRECSCEDTESSLDEVEGDESTNEENRSNKFSSLCNGFTRITRSCSSENTTTLKVLSVESWINATWPDANETKSRNFSSCSNETWFEIISKSDPSDWDSLAAEVIATQLNILSGALSENDDDLREYLTSAEDLLTECTWSDSQTAESDELLETLREFNLEKEDHAEISEIGNSASNEKSATNSHDEETRARNSLLLSILLPTILVLAVAAILVAALIIKKRQHKEVDVEL